MTTVDLLIFPTAADVAPPLTDKPGLGTKEDFMSEMFSPRRTLTSLANVVGAPALSGALRLQGRPPPRPPDPRQTPWKKT